MSTATLIRYSPADDACEKCDMPFQEHEVGSEYCDECHAYYYCECGASLGEYAGDGFCKRCE